MSEVYTGFEDIEETAEAENTVNTESNGHVGDLSRKDTEDRTWYFKNDISFLPFSKEVCDCLPKLPWIIKEKDISVRRDLRHLAIFSVDPSKNTDIDDALHCRQLPNGNYEIGVHVADVSHFLQPKTAVDEEAAKRGTLVFLGTKRILMIPRVLASNICSLKMNKERFAFTVMWEMTPKAEILSTTFCKSVIKSQAALTYSQAQLRINDKSCNDEVSKSLKILSQLAKFLKKQRTDNGALLLAFTAMDTERHDPIDVEKKESNSAMEIISEFMVCANLSVATKIYSSLPESSLLRRKSNVINYHPLIKAGLTQGFEIKVHSRKALDESLDAAVMPESESFNDMMRKISLCCQPQATYFSSGLLNKPDYCHNGLGTSIYTHFTSPIRRYADVIVHRQLEIAIGADVMNPSLVDKNKIQELSNKLNFNYEIVNYYKTLSRKKPVQGFILDIQEKRLEVLLPRYGLVTSLYFNFVKESDDENIVTDKKEWPSANGVALRKFDPISIELHSDETNAQHQQITLKVKKSFLQISGVLPVMEESLIPSVSPETEESQISAVSPEMEESQMPAVSPVIEAAEIDIVLPEREEPSLKKQKKDGFAVPEDGLPSQNDEDEY